MSRYQHDSVEGVAAWLVARRGGMTVHLTGSSAE
jgi:hypothetical protein